MFYIVLRVKFLGYQCSVNRAESCQGLQNLANVYGHTALSIIVHIKIIIKDTKASNDTFSRTFDMISKWIVASCLYKFTQMVWINIKLLREMHKSLQLNHLNISLCEQWEISDIYILAKCAKVKRSTREMFPRITTMIFHFEDKIQKPTERDE